MRKRELYTEYDQLCDGPTPNGTIYVYKKLTRPGSGSRFLYTKTPSAARRFRKKCIQKLNAAVWIAAS